MTDLRDTALSLWSAGVAAVDGYGATRAALSDADATPVKILAVGKAAAAMTRAALDHFGDIPALVVTKDGHGDGLPDHVEVIESAHPVPDARSLQGGRALRQAVMDLPELGEVLVLVSGGASALAEDPVQGKTLDDLMALNQRMLAQGLDIVAMNRQRRKLSRIKGGRLLDYRISGSARVLAISDVPHDDINVIGSGIGAALPDRRFEYRAEIVASNTIARAAAVAAAEAADLPVLGNEECLHADVYDLAGSVGARLRNMPPGALILGGEPTVVLPDTPGRGGRNQALALALAEQISGMEGIAVVVGGTDGTDGPTGDAGGIVDGTTWGDGAQDALNRADSGSYLAGQDALLTTGPTGTNVMDLLIALKV